MTPNQPLDQPAGSTKLTELGFDTLAGHSPAGLSGPPANPGRAA